MSIGYACVAVAVNGSEMKSCTLKNANEELLLSLIKHNLSALESVIDYNVVNGIKLFRISSDLIPFGSSIAADMPWHESFSGEFSRIGQKIFKAGMRVSMHPGQYTVLNSINIAVVERAIKDLDYHAKVLDALGLDVEHKMVLHLGGAYGNKSLAIKRFIAHYLQLKPAVQSRLVIENDDTMFNINDVLEASVIADIPVVFDSLHNAVNPADNAASELDWIKICATTWKMGDGLQKVHYSQQNPSKKTGAHSETIEFEKFLEFYHRLSGRDIDIMLEVKDKNISALKCINCVSNQGIGTLEREWARYKYSILERSPAEYERIRTILTDKNSYPALVMYRLIEDAYRTPINKGNAVNAAQHVWGYFKNKATKFEKNRFDQLMKKYLSDDSSLTSLKNYLRRIARKYNERYLLNGYYFYL
ncbi:MAG: UV DNA damage repair endonuclease UvsE [Clostridiales bacterium]|nr:UV DNA damage repair endonuclease UvsE [Clostridiales bacterium]